MTPVKIVKLNRTAKEQMEKCHTLLCLDMQNVNLDIFIKIDSYTTRD
jgi:hypothetical protein